MPRDADADFPRCRRPRLTGTNGARLKRKDGFVVFRNWREPLRRTRPVRGIENNASSDAGAGFRPAAAEHVNSGTDVPIITVPRSACRHENDKEQNRPDRLPARPFQNRCRQPQCGRRQTNIEPTAPRPENDIAVKNRSCDKKEQSQQTRRVFKSGRKNRRSRPDPVGRLGLIRRFFERKWRFHF